MSVELEKNQVCEACGCAGEIGFIIKEGDEVADVTVFAQTKTELESELQKYIELAKSVCADVEYNVSEVSEITEESNQATARFKFEVSAEKLIFELKTRSLAR
ncbi:TPA: YfcZ/YiiS family protein [Vibrio diabolicus]